MASSSKGIVAFDITAKFAGAAKGACLAPSVSERLSVNGPALTSRQALEPGELIKDGHFTLFESVGALEVRFIAVEQCLIWNGNSDTT